MQKRNLALILSAIILLVLGITGLILSYVLQGVDIFAWFTSKWGFIVEAGIALYALIVIIVLAKDKIRGL